MHVIKSSLDIRSKIFAKNRTDMLEMLDQIGELPEKVAQGDGEEGVSVRKWERLQLRQLGPSRIHLPVLLNSCC